jgi:hypothetical protein
MGYDLAPGQILSYPLAGARPQALIRSGRYQICVDKAISNPLAIGPEWALTYVAEVSCTTVNVVGGSLERVPRK